jgi:hypothetical protein
VRSSGRNPAGSENAGKYSLPDGVNKLEGLEMQVGHPAGSGIGDFRSLLDFSRCGPRQGTNKFSRRCQYLAEENDAEVRAEENDAEVRAEGKAAEVRAEEMSLPFSVEVPMFS